MQYYLRDPAETVDVNNDVVFDGDYAAAYNQYMVHNKQEELVDDPEPLHSDNEDEIDGDLFNIFGNWLIFLNLHQQNICK